MRPAIRFAFLLLAAAACAGKREPPAGGPWQRLDLTQAIPIAGAESLQARSFPLGLLDPVPAEAARWEGRGAMVRGIAQTPGTRISWRMRLGLDPSLSFTPLGGPHGGQRRVSARRSSGGPERLLIEAPTALPSMPAAARTEIALGEFAGEEIDLTFEAEGEDVPRITWGSPQVLWRGAAAETPATTAARPNILRQSLRVARRARWWFAQRP